MYNVRKVAVIVAVVALLRFTIADRVARFA